MTLRTTVYLPEDLKKALEQEAKRRGCSEAQVIRAALEAAIIRPRPSSALFTAEPFAEDVDDFLVGFGER